MTKPSATPNRAAAVFDEMTDETGAVRAAYDRYAAWLAGTEVASLAEKRRQADVMFRRVGITFAVYGDEDGTERLIPFDVVPRVLTAEEWHTVESGCIQRVKALNLFLHDLYHAQEIVRAGILPPEMAFQNAFWRAEMQDFDPPGGVYIHVSGVDVVRTGPNEFHVLEDNLRSPSGVSYMLENRQVMMRLFPDLFQRHRVRPVEHYPQMLVETLRAAAPAGREEPTVAVLTPGRFNSAYFEHAFLADQMGVELVEGADLFVKDGDVWMRTVAGPQRVDVIYRRIDDDFLDPLAFNPDSMLGVPGILSAYRSGRLTIANAVGTGIADDKAIYALVPDMIRFYLGEEPILKNVPTYQLRQEADLKYVLDHLAELVVKEVHGAGGYGMLIGPHATAEERTAYRARILADPAGFIAQPTLSLSTCPTLVEAGIAPRHVDLRPFVLFGDEIRVVPGGLTRVALREGSLVVNSSQGGGTKDTWVLEG